MGTSNENFGSWIKKITGTETHFNELAEDPSKEALKSEILKRFPESFVSRREFMEWMGGLVAVLSLPACTRQPEEKIFPYVRAPEAIIPGKPLFFASAYTHQGAAMGVLVESHMGRPTKIEGNPEHPGSLGSTDAFAQASILDLYDPDRLQAISFKGTLASSNEFIRNVNAVFQFDANLQGQGMRILTESTVSPTLGAQIRALLAHYPKAKWHVHDAASRANVHAGANLAFGEPVHTRYNFDHANVVLSLDSDFLYEGPGHVRYSRDFSLRRRSESKQKTFNRLYSFACTPTVTDSTADHSWPTSPQNLPGIALAIARALGLNVATPSDLKPEVQTVANLVAKDLRANAGASVVIAGDQQSAEMHALCHAMNSALGNLGKTVILTAALEENLGVAHDMESLVAELRSGAVQNLVILGGNPVYSYAAEPNLGKLISDVRFTLHHTLHSNETSQHCDWQIPDTHFLEAWSDTKSHDGTVSIVEPLIAPLYASLSVHEVMSILLQTPTQTGYEAVQAYWKTKHPQGFETYWNRSVHDGVLAGTQLPEKKVALKAQATALQSPRKVSGLQLVLRPDPTVGDGRFANNAWMQELPKPMSKVVWDNAFYLAPSTAKQLNVANGDVIRVKANGKSVDGPVWILPRQPVDCLTVHLGYGRTRAGRVGSGMGFNVSSLRNHAQWEFAGIAVEKTGRHETVVSTQRHFELEGRDLVKHTTLQNYQKDPTQFEVKEHHEPQAEGVHAAPMPEAPAVRPFADENYAWGMALDLSVCNSCNACVVACQSENNVPTVGKEEVRRQRAMHWLRIDRYYDDASDNPTAHNQPVPCMHCETAPCEVVCPVNATTHSPEGLNEMTYNRCVGTKYCSNNCPYKVRRFNWFHYADVETPQLKMQKNPNVTVRSRGVMEKCTYCVQRINSARIDSKKENRMIRDGEITPACAAACPSQAIVFGNIKDKSSRVSKLKAEPLNYGMLAELGTKPRTTYLAKLRNPNPEIAKGLTEKSF